MRLATIIALICSLHMHADVHQKWIEQYDQLLKKYVKPGKINKVSAHLVDYKSLRSGPEIRLLENTLAALPRFNKLAKNKRLALWINAYNFLTLVKIADNPEKKSIKDLNSLFKTVWQQHAGKVAGKKYTLDQIEHEIIRKEFQEPRIHFALVCAAISCPNLRLEAYTAKKLDRQLEKQLREFLQDRKKGKKIGKGWFGTKLYLSKIFKWYAKDFPGGPKKWLLKKKYILPKEAQYSLDYLDYDWALNAQPHKN